jgi:DNA-binding winged helix-turn-helix (wHTH) protein/tetratricopeptide (TPR) repeat protein
LASIKKTMHFYFDEFRYDIEKQVLYQVNELIPLKKNQAALLEFLLSDPDSIHSKDDILNAVWKNQVVSEQVVFQTISQLRSIIGHDSIKTFARKGYKWTISVSKEPFTKEHSETENKQIISRDNNGLHLSSKLLLVLGFLSILSLITLVFVQHNSNAESVKLYVLSNETKPSSSRVSHTASVLNALPQFEISHLPSSVSITQAFASPRLAYRKSNIPPEAWLMWGQVYEAEQRAILHYGLSGEFNSWQGYIEADSVELLTSQLSGRFLQLAELGLFAVYKRDLLLPELLRQLETRPTDPDLLLLVAKYHESTEQFDVALSYLQRLIKIDSIKPWSPYRAVALWKIGRIYKMRGQHTQAHHNLEAMSDVLAQLPVSPLHFQYVKTKAWLAYSETDHQAMYQALDEGFQYFDKANINQQLLKFKLHVLSSILALKVADHERKYFHLSQAQALMLKYQLDESNLAAVYYHLALFSQHMNQLSQSQTPHNEHVVYLEKILLLPRTLDNFWIHDEAMELLINHYKQKGDYALAYSLLSNESQTPKRLYLRAELLMAQHKKVEAIAFFEKAFEKANIDYDKRTAIESAVKLYHLYNDDVKKQSVYIAYLETNAKRDWLIGKLAIVDSLSE